ADAVLAGLPAGVVEELLGSGEVAGPLDVLGEPGVVDGERAVGGAAGAVEDPVDHGLAVDGQVEGAADRGVAGDGVRGGGGDGAEVVGGGPVRRALVVVLEGGGEVGRQRRAVEVTGAQPGGADVVVGDDRHGELLHLRGAAPIVRVGLEGELFSLAPVGEDVV